MLHRLRQRPVDSERNETWADYAQSLAKDNQNHADGKTLLDWLDQAEKKSARTQLDCLSIFFVQFDAVFVGNSLHAHFLTAFLRVLVFSSLPSASRLEIT